MVILSTIYYQHDSNVMYTFVPNKSFSQLIDISPKTFMNLETINSEFSNIQVWFSDNKHSKLL